MKLTWNWRSTLVVLSLEHALIQLKQCLAGDTLGEDRIQHYLSLQTILQILHTISHSHTHEIRAEFARYLHNAGLSRAWFREYRYITYSQYFLCITFIHYINQCANTEDKVWQLLNRLNILYYCVHMSIFYSSIGMCACEYTCMCII